MRDTDITIPTGLTVTWGEWAAINDAPALPMSGNIQDALGGALPINFKSASLAASTGAVTAEFQLSSVQTAAPVFKDSTAGTDVGIMLQISNPMVQTQQYVKKPNKQVIAMIPPPAIGVGWTTGTSITFSCTAADLAIDNFKEWVQLGQVIEVTASLVGLTGQQMRLGSVKTVVS